MLKNLGLILIDVQKGFHDLYWGKRNNPLAEENMHKILKKFRALNYPIFHIQHLSENSLSPLRPHQYGAEFMDFAAPKASELVLQKKVNSAFIGTDLEKNLRDEGISSLVIIGISTDHCISTSARMSGNLGFKTYVVSDATFTFERFGFDGAHYPAEDVHRIALASLHGEFATVMTTESVMGMVEF